MRKYAIAGAFLASTAFAAYGADLPQRPAPVFVPPPPPPPMWTGPFVGVFAGGSWGDGGNTIDGKGLYCVGLFCDSPSYGSDFGTIRSSGGSDGSFAGGAQLGYNFQVSPSLVLGGVIDFTWMDRSSRTSAEGPAVVIVGPNAYTERTYYEDAFRQDWLATARVKVGVALDNVLLYATGGLAAGNIDSKSSTRTTWTTPQPETIVVASGSGSTSGTALGWTAGAGVEFRFAPNWSLFGEYLYYSLNDSYDVTVTTASPAAPASATYRVKADADGHLFKVGLNYLFWSAPAAPVFARY